MRRFALMCLLNATASGEAADAADDAPADSRSGGRSGVRACSPLTLLFQVALCSTAVGFANGRLALQCCPHAAAECATTPFTARRRQSGRPPRLHGQFGSAFLLLIVCRASVCLLRVCRSSLTEFSCKYIRTRPTLTERGAMARPGRREPRETERSTSSQCEKSVFVHCCVTLQHALCESCVRTLDSVTSM